MKELCKELINELEKIKLFWVDFQEQFEDGLKDGNFKDAHDSAYAFDLSRQNAREIVFAFGLEKERIKFAKQLRSKSGKSFLKRSEAKVAQAKIVVEGDLKLTKKRYNFLPENLLVRGHLEIEECEIRKLPKGLVVEGNFTFYNKTPIDIPGDFTVYGKAIFNGEYLTESQINTLRELRKMGQVREITGISFSI